MIDYINRTRNDHIITIEDPIEFTHDDIGCVVSQREIGHDSSSFATALRAALREDPDVILVGEMRDPETMSVALHAAETGHLVFSTLHTLNSSETVNRIIGTFPPHQEQQIRDQLAAVIVGIVSQRLIPKIGGEGRIPAVEILVGTGAIKDCIREAKRTPEIPAFIAQGQSQYGMQTFDQCLLRLYRDGVISYATAREAAISAARGYGPARLRAELRARGIAAPLVAAALAGGDDDSELERARAAARRRLPALQRGDRARAAARLRDHLLRRGFAASMVARVVRECVGLAVED